MPNMDIIRWQQNVDKALSFNIPHISSYALTVEPKTALAHFINKGTVKLPADEEVEKQYIYLQAPLT